MSTRQKLASPAPARILCRISRLAVIGNAAAAVIVAVLATPGYRTRRTA